ncbi:MAG: cytoplasmic protein [Candidatus Magnetoglobus multicellularis str. Araruama]|uniref:Cytoplasmic protein n=1 Tax=Candidatus Magnetoglobus multicellularis str. Araruama TaxID=890399 RepID=A0A1V1PB32_9BACT|nr:MAG: cytoplasmic protein [Candidatus Magnetoglobus multicellularis str. Araruama]
MSLIIGFGKIILRLPENNTLKGKRKIIKSILGKMKNTFNVSAAEIGENDTHRKSELGFSMVGNNSAHINSKLDKLINMVDDMGMAEIVDTQIEIMHC